MRIKYPAAVHLSQLHPPRSLRIYSTKVKYPENVVTLQKAYNETTISLRPFSQNIS